MNFGEFVKVRRISQNYTLRAFCKKFKHDAGNWSKMERGIIPPPQKPEVLKQYAEALEIEFDTDDWYEFSDLANTDSGIIPIDILENSELTKSLPLFFRTIRGTKPKKMDLERLIELIKRSP